MSVRALLAALLLTGAPVSAQVPAQAPTAGPLVPLTTVKPKIPDSACQQRQSGWVEMDFAVLPDGKTADIKVSRSEPPGLFEGAAVEAMAAWVFPPSALPTKGHERMPMSWSDCRAAQLARPRTAGPESPGVDCAALASEGQLKGDPFEAPEAPHRVIDLNGAQAFAAPDSACVIKGRILGKGRALTAYVEFNSYTYVADPRESRERGFWVWSNTLAEMGQ